jgi:endonuclease/exonuclease/phosphatase family metal-dependent hydrolase
MAASRSLPGALLLLGLCAACPGPRRLETGQGPYLERVKAGPVWDDPARCLEAVGRGQRLSRAQHRVRLATWSLRYFPDGQAKGRRDATATDVPWVACTLAWLDADLVALQSVELTPAGQRGLDEVVATLNRLSGGRWRWLPDACPVAERPHLVLLVREDRLQLSLVTTHPQTDPTQSPTGTAECPGYLQPTLAAYVQSRGGGADFHFLTTALAPGTGERECAQRQQAWMGLQRVREERTAGRPDDDVILAADFNARGCPRRGLGDDRAELAVLEKALAGLVPPWTVPDRVEACSAFVRGGEPVTLDLFAATAATNEARGVSARAVGLCAAARCRPISAEVTFALQHLSDHCPVVFDLLDRDDD